MNVFLFTLKSVETFKRFLNNNNLLFALRIRNNENFNLLSTIIIESLGKYYKSSYVQKVE